MGALRVDSTLLHRRCHVFIERCHLTDSRVALGRGLEMGRGLSVTRTKNKYVIRTGKGCAYNRAHQSPHPSPASVVLWPVLPTEPESIAVLQGPRDCAPGRVPYTDEGCDRVRRCEQRVRIYTKTTRAPWSSGAEQRGAPSQTRCRSVSVTSGDVLAIGRAAYFLPRCNSLREKEHAGDHVANVAGREPPHDAAWPL